MGLPPASALSVWQTRAAGDATGSLAAPAAPCPAAAAAAMDFYGSDDDSDDPVSS